VKSVFSLVLSEVLNAGPVRTVEDLAGIGARVYVLANGPASTDKAILNAAYGLAKGLWGEAWPSASEAERIHWIDACEEAIREAAAEQARAPP
jgi:hypothetical protein